MIDLLGLILSISIAMYRNIETLDLVDCYRTARDRQDDKAMRHCLWMMMRMKIDVPSALFREVDHATRGFD